MFFIRGSEKWGTPPQPGTELDSVLQGEVSIYMAIVFYEDSTTSPSLGHSLVESETSR